MNDPTTATQTIEQAFTQIHRQQMFGIPLLNNLLRVQTLSFQEFEGRMMGIIITPWMMNLLILPADDDDWSALELGKKQSHCFPSRTFQFMVNEFKGIGKCQTYSLYSPMSEFVNQAHALAAAQSFLDTLMAETEATEESIVDEALLGRIMRGEETPEVNLDDFAVIDAAETVTPIACSTEMKTRVKKTLSRRNLLRGNFLS